MDGFRTMASGLYLEGLSVDHARGVTWYSDVIGGGIRGVRGDGSAAGHFDDKRKWTGGVMMNACGAVLSSGEGGIRWNDPDSGESGWLIDTIAGEPVNGINEMVPDGEGGIYFGTIDIASIVVGGAPAPSSLYRLTAAREVVPLGTIGFANGLGFDAGRRRFYCCDTFTGVWAFDVGADGTLGERTMLLAKEDADGLALDAAGNLWITGFRSGFFTRLAPDGTRLADWPTPADAITQLRFGGEDGRELWFNAVPGDGGDTLKEGGEITAAGSFLYATRCEVAGAKIAPAGFVLR